MHPLSKRERKRCGFASISPVLPAIAAFAAFAASALLASPVFAHAVAEGDKGYIQEITGINLLPFAYLGAKHMVTGYDHLLFLAGVIFFLYQLKHIALYVSLFALGHSTTMRQSTSRSSLIVSSGKSIWTIQQ